MAEKLINNIVVDVRLHEEPEDEKPHHLVMWYYECDEEQELDVVLITFETITELYDEIEKIDFKNLNLEEQYGEYI